MTGSIKESPFAISALVKEASSDRIIGLSVPMPGRHNLSNALAALAATTAAGVDINKAAEALGTFAGLARRFDVVGTTSRRITVIDDFGHNPEKCAATLRTLKAMPGRVLAFFPPPGYGPLRLMGS